MSFFKDKVKVPKWIYWALWANVIIDTINVVLRWLIENQ